MVGVPGVAWRRYVELGLPVAAGVLAVYLFGRTLAPFLPALCWAFAVAVIGDPIYQGMVRRGVKREIAAIGVILLTVAVVIGPMFAVASALARELTDAVRNGVVLRVEELPVWLRSRVDVGKQIEQLASNWTGVLSQTLSRLIGGSVWLFSQIAVALFTLFFLLRDGREVMEKAKSLFPALRSEAVDRLAQRIAFVLRVSLAGKLLLGGIQGALGGLMFGWLGLPAPVFWGAVMAFLSIFPVIGAFVVWAPDRKSTRLNSSH